MRFPHAIEAWFQKRLSETEDQTSSELLVHLVHGGLRLREGYMRVHYERLRIMISERSYDAYRLYTECLNDTFGAEYTEHLKSWLSADGFQAEVPVLTER